VRLRVFALLAAVLLGGCSDDDPAPTTSPATGRGITAQLPEGWQSTRTNLIPHLTDPRQAFVAATFPLRYRETECSHVPGSALEDLGPRDAFVELEERGTGGASMPPRPERFGPSGLGPSEASACVPKARFVDDWFDFSDAGRRFHVRVAFGPEATAETQDEAWAILDSLEIDPAVKPDWANAG
jgi:hypothetical protein